jgi:hypothetical protein
MIKLPNFKKSFDYENGFYLSCAPSRLAKSLAHYELYKQALGRPGALVECGVFKGASLARFAIYRQLLQSPAQRPLIGFDIFGAFPETTHKADIGLRKKFVKEAGLQGIGVDQLKKVLRHKGVEKNIELVKGDILKTVPAYVKAHPKLKIALLNLDTDVYEPAKVILEQLYPRIVKGGLLVLDDYGVFPGETKAVDDYFKGRRIKIRRFAFAKTPCYIVKD